MEFQKKQFSMKKIYLIGFPIGILLFIIGSIGYNILENSSMDNIDSKQIIYQIIGISGLIIFLVLISIFLIFLIIKFIKFFIKGRAKGILRINILLSGIIAVVIFIFTLQSKDKSSIYTYGYDLEDYCKLIFYPIFSIAVIWLIYIVAYWIKDGFDKDRKIKK